MEKYGMIFASVIFTLVIMLIPNQIVDAADYSYDIDTMYSFESLPDATIEQLLDTIEFLKSIEDDYYVYFTFIDSSNYYNISIIDKNNSVINKSFINYSSKTMSGNISFINNTATGFTKEFRNYNYVTSVESVKSDVNNKNFRTIYSVSSSSTKNFYLIYSNVEFTINTLGSSNEILSGGNSLKSGDIFPSWYDWYMASQNNSFNEVISTNIYTKLEFDFTLPMSESICTKDEYIDGVLTKVEYICPALELDYNIFSSDKQGNSSGMIFGIPYFIKRYLYDNGTSSINKSDTIPLASDMSGIYQGSYVLNNDSSITKFKLIVDLTGLNYSYVTIQFDSSIPFEVTYYEKESEVEYIDSVDLTGKAGVMFIPKQIEEDMLLNFSFYQNEYSVQLRDTYKSDFNVLNYYSVGYCDDRNYISDIPYICNNGTSYTISVEFKKGNLEQSLFVVNRDYPNKDTSIIYYDTRYFDYIIYNTLADSPTFSHPITGEQNTSNSLIDFDSAITNQDGFFKEMSDALNHFKGVIIEIFENISYLFINLPLTLRYFFIAVFSLILIIFLTRFIL